MQNAKRSKTQVTCEVLQDAYKQERLDLLGKYNLTTSCIVAVPFTASALDALLQILRICQLTEFELYQVPAQWNGSEMLSPFNEMRSLQVASQKLQALGLDTQLVDLRYEQQLTSKNGKAMVKQANNDDNALSKWASENGIVLDSHLQVADMEHSGKGLVAAKSIAAHTQVLQVPSSIILCANTARAMYPQVFTSALDNDSVLLFFILYEKYGNKQSKWKTYFDHVPQNWDSFPLNYTAEQLTYVEGTPLYFEVIKTTETLQQFAMNECMHMIDKHPLLFSVDVLNIANLIWARMMIDSRAITFEQLGGHCLIPIVDLQNDSLYPNVKGVGKYHNGHVVMETACECKPGEELFLCYGPYSNQHLLLHYGFVMNDNPYDHYTVELDIPQDDLLAKKQELLRKYNLGIEQYLLGNGVPNKLLAAMRICLLTEEAMEQASADSFNPYEKQDHDDEVFDSLSGMLEALIASLPVIDDDDDDAPVEAITYIAGVKRILEQTYIDIFKLQQE